MISDILRYKIPEFSYEEYQELVIRHKQGDDEAISLISNSLIDYIYRISQSQIRKKHIPDYVVEDIMIEALGEIPNIIDKYSESYGRFIDFVKNRLFYKILSSIKVIKSKHKNIVFFSEIEQTISESDVEVDDISVEEVIGGGDESLAILVEKTLLDIQENIDNLSQYPKLLMHIVTKNLNNPDIGLNEMEWYAIVLKIGLAKGKIDPNTGEEFGDALTYKEIAEYMEKVFSMDKIHPSLVMRKYVSGLDKILRWIRANSMNIIRQLKKEDFRTLADLI